MNRRRAFTLIELIILVVILAALVAALIVACVYGRSAMARAGCEKNVRVIGIAMMQFAGDHDDNFMPLPQGIGDCACNFSGTIVPGGMYSRSGFAVLLHDGYITTDRVFVCPSSKAKVDPAFLGLRQPMLSDLSSGLTDANCSYAWDPTKKHWVCSETCAILADTPRRVPGPPGSARNNSENHRSRGQNVFFNNGQVKWLATPRPDNGTDPDIYTGGSGYEMSNTDAYIIR